MTDKTVPLTLEAIVKEKEDKVKLTFLESLANEQVRTNTALHNATVTFEQTKEKAATRTSKIKEVADSLDKLTTDQIKVKLSEISALPF